MTCLSRFLPPRSPEMGLGLVWRSLRGLYRISGGVWSARNSEQSGAVFEVTLPIIDNH
jgi:signal transduction histidine kinase